MCFWYIWQTYSTGITKKELKNVEIQEQTASLHLLKKSSTLPFVKCYKSLRNKHIIEERYKGRYENSTFYKRFTFSSSSGGSASSTVFLYCGPHGKRYL